MMSVRNFWEATVVEIDPIIRLLRLDTETETIVLKNFGTVEENIADYQFCLGPGQYNVLSNYTNVIGDLTLSPNEEVTIDLTSGSAGVTALPDANGAIALFTQANFGSNSPDDLEDYIQWGAANQARVDQAVEAGRWDSAESFVAGDAPFNYIGGANDVGAEFWEATVVEIDPIIRLLRLDTETETIVLKNFGTVEENIADYQFCLGPGQYNVLSNYTNVIGDLTLSPNEEVTIDLTSGSAGVTALPDANGAIALFTQANFGSNSPDDLEDYIQWGAANQARVDQAVEAGRWDSAESFVAGQTPFNYIGGANDVGANFWSDDTAIRLFQINPETDIVIVKNFDSIERDINGYFLCTKAGVYPQFGNPSQVEIVQGDLTLSPGEEVIIKVLTDEGVVDVDGSIFLFSSGILGFNNQNPFVMRDFAQWGAPNGFRVENAVAAGRWDSANSFIPGDAPFNYIGGANDVGAEFWEATVVEIDPIIRLLRLDTETETIVLKNFGTVEENIADYQFCLGPGQYNVLSNYTNVIGDLTLSPNEEVTIDLTSGSAGVTALPDANGAIALFTQANFGSNSPDDLEDYIQWGAANQARVDQAVEAGRWDSAESFVAGDAPFNYIGGANDVGAEFWESTVIIGEGIDLELVVTTNDNNLNLFTDLILEFTVTNSGSEVASGVIVDGSVPEGFAFSGVEISQGSYNSFTQNFEVGTLAPGASANMTLRLFVLDVSPTIYYTQVLEASPSDVDSAPGNNPGPTPQEDDEAAVSLISNPVVNIPPVPVLNFHPTSGSAPLVVDFDAFNSNDPDGVIVDYAWDFGDGNSANGITAINTYQSPGTYTITLIVTDNLGATGTSTATINVFDVAENVDLELSLFTDDQILTQYTTTTIYYELTNEGTETANNIKVAAPVPAGFAFANSNAIDGNYDLFRQTWNVGNLAPGETARLELGIFTLLSPSSDPVIYYAQVTAANPQDLDSTPNNNGGPTPLEDDEAALTLSFNAPAGGFLGLLSSSLEDTNQSLILYPNPVQSQLTIKLNSADKGSVPAQIIDINGRIVKSFIVDKMDHIIEQEVNVNELNPGVYYLRIKTSEKLINTPFKVVR